jgi:HlyD family secretion protein
MPDIARPSGRKPRTRVRLALTAALITAGVLGFCHFREAAPRVSRESLYIDKVRAGSMVVEIRAAGTLAAEDTEWIPASIEGRVERTLVRPGAAVTPDTLLLELSNAQVAQAANDADLQVRAAEAELRSRAVQLESQILAQEAVVATANAEYAEARNRAGADAELAAAGLTSRLNVETTRGREQQLAIRALVEQKRLDLARRSEQTDLAAARSRLEQLRAVAALRHEQLDGLLVRAGRSGIVQQIAVEVGARVAAGTNLARVAAREPLEAVLQISQVEASQIAPGQRVQIDTHSGVVIGRVARIDPAVQNGSVTVDVQLPRGLPRGARPDLSVDGTIEVERVERALSVGRPVRARAHTSIALFRLSEDGRSATRVPVRLGRTSFNSVEILSGLRAGDRVILSDTTAYEKYEHITLTGQEKPE